MSKLYEGKYKQPFNAFRFFSFPFLVFFFFLLPGVGGGGVGCNESASCFESTKSTRETCTNLSLDF